MEITTLHLPCFIRVILQLKIKIKKKNYPSRRKNKKKKNLGNVALALFSVNI